MRDFLIQFFKPGCYRLYRHILFFPKIRKKKTEIGLACKQPPECFLSLINLISNNDLHLGYPRWYYNWIFMKTNELLADLYQGDRNSIVAIGKYCIINVSSVTLGL